MNGEFKKSFLEWLSEQAYREDDTGKFARDMIAADDVPKTSHIYEWYKYIKEKKEYTVREFIKVWEEYIDEGLRKGEWRGGEGSEGRGDKEKGEGEIE